MLVAATTPGQARRDAQAILDGDAYKTKTGARPLRGVLQWIGDLLAPIGRAITTVWNATLGKLPPILMWAVVIALIALGIYLLARNTQSRSAARTLEHDLTHSDAGHEAVTAADLDREASAADQRGDLALGIRLRFRAGLLRLEHDAHVIVNRPGLTTREVRSTLQIDKFESLANTFEGVAYGNKVANDLDSHEAREQWPDVISDASRG